MPNKIKQPTISEIAENVQLKQETERQFSEAHEAQQAKDEIKPEIVTSIVKQSQADGTREMTRSTKSGRFVKKQLLKSQEAMLQTQKVLAAKDEDGKSMQTRIEEKLAADILAASAEDLIGSSKAYETLMSRGYGKPMASPMDHEENQYNKVSIVFVQNPNVPFIGEFTGLDTPSKPQWEETPKALPPSTKEIPHAEVTYIETDAPEKAEEEPKDDGFFLNPSKYDR